MQRSADVTISIYWDTRWKKWGLVVRGEGYTRSVTARTTAELDEVNATLLMYRVRETMEQLLPSLE